MRSQLTKEGEHHKKTIKLHLIHDKNKQYLRVDF